MAMAARGGGGDGGGDDGDGGGGGATGTAAGGWCDTTAAGARCSMTIRVRRAGSTGGGGGATGCGRLTSTRTVSGSAALTGAAVTAGGGRLAPESERTDAPTSRKMLATWAWHVSTSICRSRG